MEDHAIWWPATVMVPSLELAEGTSLALPDPLRPGAYRLEIISAGLLGSGPVHRPQIYTCHQWSVGVN